MKSTQCITAIFLLTSHIYAQKWGNKAYPGPPPASLSHFFATQSTPPAYSQQTPVAGWSTTATANPLGNDYTTAPVPNPASESNLVPTSNSPSTASPSGTSSPNSSGGNCITFSSDDSSWSYSNSAPWTGSGTFGDLPGGKICFPGAGAGGAMYIGSSANPGAGNTKLECYFPTDGGQGNCDVSLVDGYSLSVTCNIEGGSQPTIGGSVDLWTSGTCPGGDQNGFCANTKAYDAAQSDVDTFFQPGVQSPSNYCIWWACTQDSFFNAGAAISCHVGAGTPAAKSRRGFHVKNGRVHGKNFE